MSKAGVVLAGGMVRVAIERAVHVEFGSVMDTEVVRVDLRRGGSAEQHG